jgi:MscS family membrane protein
MEWLRQFNSEVGDVLGVTDIVVETGLVVLLAVLAHFLLRAGFLQLHRLAQSNRQRWDDVVVTALERPARTVVWILAAYLAAQLLFENGSTRLNHFISVAYDTALLLLLAWCLLRLVTGVEEELLSAERRRDSTDKAAVHATAKLLRIVIWVLSGLMVLQSLGVSVSGLLAFGGVGGIAVGFAAKDLLANFFGALSIYLDRPFTTGDWIRSPDQEIEGTVEDVGWRLTRIRTFDQRPLYVPNAVFSNISVENPSRMRNRRIYETVGIRYQDGDKMATIVAEVRQMLEGREDIDLSRTLIVNFVSFGPSSLDFFIYAFTKTTQWVEFHAIKQDVLLKVLQIIHDNGADVAFPTRTLHLQPVSAEPEP